MSLPAKNRRNIIKAMEIVETFVSEPGHIKKAFFYELL